MHDPVSEILSNKGKFERWSAFNSFNAIGKVSRTNHGVLAPLLRSPPTSRQTLYTALCLAQKINVSVVGIHRRTVIALDLDLYERAVKIRANTGHTHSWVLHTDQSSDILQHSQNRPTGDRWLKF